MPQSGCMGCEERHEGCHSECERYKAFRKELDDKNRRKRLENAARYSLIEQAQKRKEEKWAIIRDLYNCCAGIAGVINTASIGTARANMGPQSQILDIISAAVIGGVSTSGGSGRVRDAVLGAFLVCGLTNVMNLLNVSDYYTTLIKGGIIIGAMGIASFRQQQAAKKGV